MGNTAGTIRRPSELHLNGHDRNGAGGCGPGNQSEADPKAQHESAQDRLGQPHPPACGGVTSSPKTPALLTT